MLPVSCIAQAETASQDAQNETHLLHWDQPVPVAHQVPLESAGKTEIHQVRRGKVRATHKTRVRHTGKHVLLEFIHATKPLSKAFPLLIFKHFPRWRQFQNKRAATSCSSVQQQLYINAEPAAKQNCRELITSQLCTHFHQQLNSANAACRPSRGEP